MDRVMTTEEFEQEVRETMRSQGIDYDQAEVIVAMRHGELHGDLLCVRPLTDEQRRRQRRTLLEVMAELGELDDLPTETEEPALSIPDRRVGRIAN
jgi:hypothetical protein